MVGRTPWSARVPPDPLFPNEINWIWPPARGPAADQGVRPTIYADRITSENYVAQALAGGDRPGGLSYVNLTRRPCDMGVIQIWPFTFLRSM